jgi:gamma-glutamylcyclotransferase (GGCT)/AIG2-like uncharacterized protein YtfP
MKNEETTELLFSYGTLQDEDVQLATFGRELEGEVDSLPRYGQTTYGPHLNLEFTGQESDAVAGMCFKVTSEEILQADVYEATANYKRILVELKSGERAWVYLHMDGKKDEF